ncbi:MAG TPA: hypothetical protein VHU22_24060 [Xanthobacteraceae bacterium]|jgi:hypothetical protein|nr:hypothetical protein [Xanthobacteraceae bacterium]
MTVDAVPQHSSHRPARAEPRGLRRARRFFTLPFVGMILLASAAAAGVSYLLWPTWPSTPAALDAPSIPITVAGVLFNVPPRAIREKVQRHPGQQDRIDLAFDWPSLAPPQSDDVDRQQPLDPENAVATATATAAKRFFVTIAPLGTVLPPLERLRTIYPRYVESQAAAGADSLAILPFRAGTPYESEDLVYLTGNPEQFYARCTRPGHAVPGTCIQERSIGADVVSLRFPRDWLNDWRNVNAGFDRLLAQMHPGN